MTANVLANSLPWALLAGALIYLLTIAWLQRIFPSRQVLVIGLASFVLSIAGVAIGFPLPISLIADGILALLLVIDQATLLGNADLRATRLMQKTASIGKPHSARITLMNYSKRSWHVHVKDDYVQELNPAPSIHLVDIKSRQSIELEYTMRPTKRGVYQFENIYLRRFSLLRFWSRYQTIKVPGELHVYPDMQQLAEYAILARTNRLSLIGVRRTRRVGQDNNFERLRDYNQDDNFKHIDWRSTGRRNKLTVKQFQSDQSQRVMFLLDCGRMMTNEHNDLSMVDHALNAILMLSYVALAQGDSVGMMAFSNQVHSFVPMRSGKSQMNRLIHAGFDRFPEFVPTRFDQAFLHFTNNCRRRSMVFLITNVVDEVSAGEVSNYLSSLTRSHLPVLALMRDYRVFNSADNPDENEEVLYRSAAAANILLWRADIIRKMQRSGILAIDAFPEELTSPMVNQYLEAKAKHLL